MWLFLLACAPTEGTEVPPVQREDPPDDSGPAPVVATPTAPADATPGWFGQLAFGARSGRWLVASQSGGIVGRLMSADGAPATEVFQVSPDDHTASWAPTVAYAEELGAFGVVWVDYAGGGGQAWMRLVGEDGAPVGDAVALPLGQPVANLGGERTSALAWDAERARFVYAWHGTHLATLAADGTVGATVDLSAPSPGDPWGASVAVDPDDDAWCVGYDRRNEGRIGLTRVDADAARADPGSTADIAGTNVTVLHDAARGGYLVVYDTGYTTGVKALVLGSCDLADERARFDLLPAAGTVTAARSERSDTWAIVAQNAQDDGNTFLVFDEEGSTVTSGDPFLGTSATGNFAPEIAPNPDDGTFAAISSADYTQTRLVARLGLAMDGGR